MIKNVNMKKSLVTLIMASLAWMPMMTGCATNEGPEYSGNSYDNIKRIQVGTVIGERPVVVKDDGKGTFIGAITGAVIGSTMGSGSGSTLMALGGGLGGAYAGSEIGKSNAEELTVELTTGDVIVIVVKGEKTYQVGDRIKIIKDGNTVADVQKLAPADSNNTQ